MPGNPRTWNFRMEHIKFLFPSYELQHLICSETWTKPEGPGVQRPLGRLAEDQSSSAPAQYLLHSRGFFPLLANEKWLLCFKIVSRRKRLELGSPAPLTFVCVLPGLGCCYVSRTEVQVWIYAPHCWGAPPHCPQGRLTCSFYIWLTQVLLPIYSPSCILRAGSHGPGENLIG